MNARTVSNQAKNKHLMCDRPDLFKAGTKRSNIKEWRPVALRQHQSRKNELDMVARKKGDENGTLSCESCQMSCSVDSSYTGEEGSAQVPEEIRLGSFQSKCREAEAFLAQRWKEAIAGEHVMLLLSPESEPAGCSTDQ